MSFENPNPTCERDCRFTQSGTYTTALGWTRVFDKHGNDVSVNPNTVGKSVFCSVCRTRWDIVKKRGVTTITQTPPPATEGERE